MKFQKLFTIVLMFSFFSTQAQSVRLLELGQNWQFRQSGSKAWMPATVPGSVHTDLLANGKIEDPYYRNVEKDVQWIDKTDWEYRTSFVADEEILKEEKIDLVFKGLDTYSEIYLNDKKILSTDNFFVAWEVDIKPHLKSGSNELRILFYSPIQKGLELLANNGHALPASNDQSHNGGVGDHRVSIFTRKPGYHYGWDWGPRLVSSGIWQAVFIRAYSGARIADLHFKQDKISNKKAKLRAVFTIVAAKKGRYDIAVKMEDKTIEGVNRDLIKGKQEIEIPFTIKKPKLWWTYELGEPHLYPLEGIVSQGDNINDSRQHKVGLRTVKVIREKDAKGSSFYFELNGIPVFAKGANYIPNDVFIPRVSDERYEFVLQTALKSNMNMLRIWGGGFYEKDIFYDLCDEYGIMVWQDYMFACSMYPGDEAFLKNVEKEAVYNLKRLRNHPSVVMWCGNNEIDVAWANFEEKRGWGWKQRYGAETRKKIWRDYEAVFHEMLPLLTAEHSPNTFYWPSSPYASEGKHATYNSAEGDVHYWGVWHGQHPFHEFDNYIGRFMSEYGFQSFPEFSSVRRFTEKEDWDIESDVMMAHQRSGIGNLRIMKYMEDHYHVPSSFEHILYTGQLLQAKGIGYAIEAHRRARPYCMGTLYWQLNDCWPVASWSGMDYYLSWKAMQYAVRDAFKPVILSSVQIDNSIELFLISDIPQATDYEMECKLIDFDGNMHFQESALVLAPKLSAHSVKSYYLDQFKGLDDLNECVLLFQLKQKDKIIDEHLHFFSPEKELQLSKDYVINTGLNAQPDGSYDIKISADKFVKGVYLSFGDIEGHFSDNYFDLLPGESKLVHFIPKSEVRLNANQLKHICLQDVTP